MIPNTLKNWESELVAIRRDLHAHPELAFEEKRTSSLVAKLLSEWGWRVETIAGTGVVGTLTRGSGNRSIAIRADMDALPIMEQTGAVWASRTPGKMHACGHDGHTTMLLGAARQLAAHGNFSGTVHLFFQPAEEDIGGAERMILEGLFRRFPCDAVFGLHNLPGLKAGAVLVKSGPVMAAVDIANVTIHGRGGHGGMPHLATDTTLCAASIVVALQSIVARNVDPADAAVITAGALNAGSNATVIPETARIEIGVRSIKRQTRDLLESRITTLIRAQAESFGCRAEIDYSRYYPATVNSAAETDFVRDTLKGAGVPVMEAQAPFMFSEDFAYMLQERPGCFFFLGMGDEPDRRFLHDPAYDFNDDCLVGGAALWAELAERYLPA